MRKLLATVAGCGAQIGAFVIYGLGLVIHLLTSIIAYGESGLIGAVVTFCLPVFAELFWTVRISMIRGTILNAYTGWIGMYVAAVASVYLLMWLATRLDPDAVVD